MDTNSTTFAFDTSGRVAFPISDYRASIDEPPAVWTWSDLTPFAQGKTEAMFAELQARMERLPQVDGREWPDFGGGPKPYWQDQEQPFPVAFTDGQGKRWDVVWHGVGEVGAWKRTVSQTPLSYEDRAFRHLAPETLARIIADCEDARRDAGGEPLTGEDGAEYWSDRQAGKWPGRFPPLTVYLNDEGQVCLRDA